MAIRLAVSKYPSVLNSRKFTSAEEDEGENTGPVGNRSFSVVSFVDSSHGSTAATRAMAHKSKEESLFKWRRAELPRLRYPFGENEEYNNEEEEKAIRRVRSLVSRNEDVAAILVEPIQNSTNRAAILCHSG